VAQGLGADHAERSPDVESAPSHHCRHCREAPGQRGCPQLRGCPVLGLHPACPVPGRRGRRVRAAVPPPEDPGFDNQIFADMLASIERLSDEDLPVQARCASELRAYFRDWAAELAAR
jgi:hypothetical protein